MNNVTKVLWEKYWGKNNDIETSTIFKLIDLYLAPISEGEKEKFLNTPISMFRSLSILFRWIYFKLFKDDEIEPEIVEIISPLDLPELLIKENPLFNLGDDKSNDSKNEFILGKSKCPSCGNIKYLEDNRQRKKQDIKYANIPDFSCSNFREKNGCGWGGYINTNSAAKKVPSGWVSTFKDYYPYDNESRELFYEWNKSQIIEASSNLQLNEVLYDSKNSKVIKDYWLNNSDKELIKLFKENSTDKLQEDLLDNAYEKSLLIKLRKHFENE